MLNKSHKYNSIQIIADERLGVEIEPLGEMKLSNRDHEIRSDGVRIVEVLLLVELHEHVDLAHHLDELELIGASTKHGGEAFDEGRAVEVAVRHEAANRRVPDEKVRARWKHGLYWSRVHVAVHVTR